MRLFMNTTLFDVQNDVNCTSDRGPRFQNFLGDHAPSPPLDLRDSYVTFFHTTPSATYQASASVASWKTSEIPVC